MIKFLLPTSTSKNDVLLKKCFLMSLFFLSTFTFGQKIKNESSVCGTTKVTPYKEFKLSNTFSCTDPKTLTSCQAVVETEDGFTHVSSVITHSTSGVKYVGICKSTNGINSVTFENLPDLLVGEKYLLESTYKSNLYKNNDGKDNTNDINAEIEDQSTKKISITFSAKCNGLANKSTSTNSYIFNTKPCITKGVTLSPSLCNGKDGYIKLTGLLANKTYKVNYLKNGIQSSVSVISDANGVITIENLSSGEYTSFNVNLGVLTSNTLADKIILTNPALKTITKGTFVSPSTCGGSEGNIVINGFISNTVYGISYTKNGNVNSTTLTSNSTGSISISNLSIGEYSNLYASLNDCKTNIITDKISLVNPVLKTIVKSTIVSPTTCGGSNGSITLTGFNNATNYKVSYTRNGVITSTTLSSTTNGSLVLANLSAAEYSNISASLNGCTTNTITDKIILSDPILKTIAKGTVTSPTTCAGTNGSIQLTGLNSSTTYAISFTKNNVATTTNLNSTSAGILTISNLSAGEYSNFKTSLLNCNTNIITDKITLLNPPLKTISKSAFISPKTCSSKDGSINLTGFNNNTNYDINFTKNGVNTITNLTSSASGIITISGLNAAEYSNFTGSFNGCITNTIVDKITLISPSSPAITKGNVIAPTSCNTFDGSIQLNGLVKNTSYSVTYTKNNVTTSATATTSTNGILIISSLGAAEYSNFYVTLGGCMSNLISDKITLSNPTVPTLTKGLVSNPTTCTSKDGSIEIKGFDNNKSFTLYYKKDGADVKIDQIASSIGSIKLLNLENATYSNFYTTVKSCNSNIITENITITNPINITIGIENSLNTSNCSLKDGAIQLNGLASNTTYSCKFTKNTISNSVIATSNNTGILNIGNLEAGDYTNIYVAINGCVSNTITDKITIATPAIPTFTLGQTNSSTKCLSNDGIITLTTSALNTEHTVNFTKNGINTNKVINSENGLLVLTGLEKGEYSNFYIQVKGCLSSTNTTKITLIEPITPTITKGNISNPTNCTINDGFIELNGLIKGINYQISYNKNDIENQIELNADNNGSIKISNLEAANYKNIKASSLNCTSNSINDLITLNNPVNLKITLGNTTNTTNCLKDDGTIQIIGLNPLTTYDYSYTKDDSLNSSTITTDANGNVNLTGLEAATYNNFVFSTKGCYSNVLVNEVSISTPNQPTLSIVNSVNPSKCNANDGSITFKTSGINLDHTVNFSKNDGANSFDTKSVNNLITISNLGEGKYSDFSFSIAGCNSKVDTTIITLYEPVIQTISISNKSNPTSCVSNDGQITISGLTKSSNYLLHFNKNKYTIDTTFTSNLEGNIVISNLEIANYSQIYLEANGCNSNVINDTISFITPVNTIINKEKSSNTSNCQLNDGSISINGAQSVKNYQVIYSKDNVTYSNDITSNDKGIITLTNLSTGEYYDIKVSIGGCVSNIISDKIKISSPISPLFTISSQNSPITCGGIEGSILLSTNNDDSYIVNYTKNGYYISKNIISKNKIITIDNLDLAVYSNFYITTNGCSSTTNNTIVTLKDPSVASISLNNFANPTTCISNDGKIQLTGFENSILYSLSYTKNGNVTTGNVTSSNSGEIIISNLEPAIYSNFTVQKNNCISNSILDNVEIKDPTSPKLILGTSKSPTICNGNDGLIEFSGLEKNLEYTITYNYTSVNSINKISSSANGSLALLNLKPGDYSNFSVTYNDCQSNIIADVITLSNSSIPTIKLGAVTLPTTCSSCNGQIELKGLIKNNTYTVTYKRNNEIESREFTADNSGNGYISSLAEGTYTELTVIQNTCQSNTLDNTIVISSKETNSTSSCKNIQVNIEDNGVKNVSCAGINDGTITFTITNGSSNNLYRIRKKNYNGTFTVVTFPAYSPV